MPRHARRRLQPPTGAPRPRPRPRRPVRRVRWARVVLLTLTFGCLFVMAACADVVYHAVSAVPVLSDPTHQISTSSQIFDGNGQFVTLVPGATDRQPVDISQIPQQLQQAFIATEDRSFYTNIGISFRGIGRAAMVDVTHRFQRSTLQGASTITQQLADILYLNRRDSITRKLQEAVVAVELNRRYTKPQVLDMYLNDVYLGEHSTGVVAAAATYFNQTDLSKLTLPQMALLAGLPQAPSSYDPFVHPKAALTRRNEVLQYMVAAGYITPAQAAAATRQPLGLSRGTGTNQTTTYPDPWFVDAVIETLEQPPFNLSEQEIVNGGLKIYTTLNPSVEQAAQQSVTAHMKVLPTGMQTGVAVVDVHTGDVVALIGGVQHTGEFALNRATQITRQPGSSMKPLADYIPALESGLTAGTVVDDVPHSYPNGTGGQYIPKDDSPPYYGLTTFTEALRRSVNTVAIAVLNHVGVQRGFDNAKAMGLPLSSQDDYLPLAIGGISGTTCCSPLNMADAYATIANGGMHVTPRIVTKVVGPDGQLVATDPVQFKQVVDPKAAYVMTKMLETVNNPQPNTGWDEVSGPYDSNWGTGYDASVRDNIPNWPSAGKTGTTENNQDAWFVGFTPLYSAAVWIGYDQPKPFPGLYGGTYAGPIWKDTMEAAVAPSAVQHFPRPQGIVQAPIDIKCAEWHVCSPGPLTPSDMVRSEWFINGTQPTPATSAQYELWKQVQVTAGNPNVLWNPSCGGTPVTKVALDRPYLSMAWANPIAAYFGWRYSASVYLPVDETDQSISMPQQSCAPTAGAGGNTGGGNQQSGTGQTGACGESWQVEVALGQPATPPSICIYRGQTAQVSFSATDGRVHQLSVQGFGALTIVPADGTPATLALTPQKLGQTLILLDGAPIGRLDVQAPPSGTGN